MILKGLQDLKYHLPNGFNHGNISIPYWYSKASIEEALQSCTLSFVASVGREGSGFVSDLFSAKKAVISLHEPRPYCNGQSLIRGSMRCDLSSERNLRIKLSTIAKTIRKSRCEHYLESSHMFLKTFGRYLVNEYDAPFNLISLRRPFVETVISFYELAWFSHRFSRAANWIYKVSEYSPLTAAGLIIENSTDEIMSYIISEKKNEVNLLSAVSPSRINYVRLDMPPSSRSIKFVSESIGLSVKMRENLRAKNRRTNAKIHQISSERVLGEICSYFLKNRPILMRQSVEFCQKTMEVTIGGEKWGVI